jgi:hypothetical protein
VRSFKYKFGLFVEIVMLAKLGGDRIGHEPAPAAARKSWHANLGLDHVERLP